MTINGLTMGTYYKITYSGNEQVSKAEVDKLLVELNNGLSTYQENSIISQINRNELSQLNLSNQTHSYFFEVLERSKYFYAISEQFFDPTVMPLVNYYGFGYVSRGAKGVVDSSQISDILHYVSLDKLQWIKKGNLVNIKKLNPKTELDFSAIAKGYGVDEISAFLESKKIQNYLVDIGGEIRVKGKNPKNQNWSLGVSKPIENARYDDAEIIVQLSNTSLATSGNYRNFYEKDGVKYSHTINPKSGVSERSNLLGTSIITEKCMDADALATVCMVIGLEKSIALIEKLSGVEGCLIYNQKDSLQMHYSSGFKDLIK